MSKVLLPYLLGNNPIKAVTASRNPEEGLFPSIPLYAPENIYAKFFRLWKRKLRESRCHPSRHRRYQIKLVDCDDVALVVALGANRAESMWRSGE
jgi:hypothetical protein